jgi:hypothetical protein
MRWRQWLRLEAGGDYQIRDGRVRALAVATPKRLAALPDVPTVSESGVPGYEVIGWAGILAPAGTSADIVRRLNAAINESLRTPEMMQRFSSMELLPMGGTAEAFGAFVRSEVESVAGIATYPIAGVLCAAQALKDNLTALAASRSLKVLPRKAMDIGEFKDCVGFHEIEELHACLIASNRISP